jgi:hypothetical protein
MAKYPVEISDSEGIVDAVNYVLSGPSGLGQNFAGFSASTTGYLTGNFRVPYSQTYPVATYVADVALSTAEMLDGRTFKFTFAATQPNPPFQPGNVIDTFGFANDWYNDYWSPIGVVQCTVDYVIVRTTNFFPNPGPDTSGGFAAFSITSIDDISTDCNARVTVTGPTDRVFINAQLNSIPSYIAADTSPVEYTVKVNRYRGEINNDPVNPDYVFNLDGDTATVASRLYALGSLDPTTGQVFAVALTGGTNHISRTTFPRTYQVLATTTSGVGFNCSLEIELLPAISTSSTGLSSGGPYFAPNQNAVPYRTEPWNYKAPTAVAEAAGILTITVDNSTSPFFVGQSLTLVGADPYNGTYKIITATATYLEVETSVTGTATLEGCVIFNPFFNATIKVLGGGLNFVSGDTLLVKGSQIGGVDGTNDMTLEVGASTNPFNGTPLSSYDTVFTSIIDVPGPGYYWYILEITFYVLGGDAQLIQLELGYRGLSAQVVKE